jgi:hypothetical protein
MDTGKLVALKDKLRADGQEGAADFIDRAVGLAGDAGVAKSFTEFFQQNPEELGELGIPIKLTMTNMQQADGKTVIECTVSTNFGTTIGGGLAKAITVGIIGTIGLALPR